MKGRCLATALAVTLFTFTASAQSLIVDEASIGLRAKLPRSGVALHGALEGLDAWLPFEVVLSNPGQEEVSGSLHLLEANLAGRRSIHSRRALTLGPGAHQRLSFPVLYDSITTYHLEFTDRAGAKIELKTARGDRAQVALPLLRPTGERLVLFARRQGDLRPLERMQPTPKGDTLIREWIVAEIEPARLPTSGLGYHRVDMVVLEDLSLDELSSEQQRALLEFAARGGLLWVSTLTRKPGAGAKIIAAALPGTPREAVQLRRAPSLEAFSDYPLPPRAQTFMTFEPKADATAWGQEQVVVHRRHDQGWIFQAGFRLSEPQVLDARILIRQMLSIRQRGAVQPPTAYTVRLRRALTFALRATSRKSVPPLRVVLGLLGVYLVVVVALPFAALRRSGRLELAWIFVAVVAVGGVIAVDLLGARYLKPSSAARISVVGGGTSGGTHRRTSHWAVFSEKGGPLAVRFAEGSPAPFPMPGDPSPLRWTGEQEVTLETHPQDTTLFLSSEACELKGGLKATVQADGALLLRVAPGGPRLLGAWAWNAAGDPIVLSGARISAPAEGDRFAEALRVLKSYTGDVAQRERRVAVLYRYEGPAMLANMPEESLEVGLLLLDPPLPSQQSERVVTCERRAIEEPSRDNGYRSTWAFSHSVGADAQVSQVLINLRRQYGGWNRGNGRRRAQPQVALFDWERRTWRELERLTLPAEDLVHVSPLGVARGRVSITSDDHLVPEVRLRLRRTP